MTGWWIAAIAVCYGVVLVIAVLVIGLLLKVLTAPLPQGG